MIAGCSAPSPPAGDSRIGQWIWSQADVARFTESRRTFPALEAGVFIGAVECDAEHRTLSARAGLSAAAAGTTNVVAVIRFEDGLERCRTASAPVPDFNQSLDSVVRVLRRRSSSTVMRTVHLDYDAPVRALEAWSASVAYLDGHALRADSVWVTSILAHVRDADYGDLFRDVAVGHVLQVFDTGEIASEAGVREAVRLAARARMPFRLGLGAFERETRAGRTEHRAWFGAVPQFSAVDGFRGVWVFPAGHRWVTYLRKD
jgi:hypothetical protein